jgi:four helix bundle protein
MEETQSQTKPSERLNMAGFRDLYVWREGKALALKAFRRTQAETFSGDDSFRDQVRRSTIRVPGNIAEGNERGTRRDTVRFLMIARASLAKRWTQLEFAGDLHDTDDETMKGLSEHCRKLRRMLTSLIQARARLL